MLCLAPAHGCSPSLSSVDNHASGSCQDAPRCEEYGESSESPSVQGSSARHSVSKEKADKDGAAKLHSRLVCSDWIGRRRTAIPEVGMRVYPKRSNEELCREPRKRRLFSA